MDTLISEDPHRSSFVQLTCIKTKQISPETHFLFDRYPDHCSHKQIKRTLDTNTGLNIQVTQAVEIFYLEYAKTHIRPIVFRSGVSWQKEFDLHLGLFI